MNKSPEKWTDEQMQSRKGAPPIVFNRIPPPFSFLDDAQPPEQDASS
jgi:hypothetical protein